MEALAIALLIPLIKKIVDFVRYIRAGISGDKTAWNGVITQLVVWGTSVGATTLAAHTAFASNLSFGNTTLASVNFVSQLFVGLMLGSTASLTQDTLKSIDNKNTSRIPTLLPSPVSPDDVG